MILIDMYYGHSLSHREAQVKHFLYVNKMLSQPIETTAVLRSEIVTEQSQC